MKHAKLLIKLTFPNRLVFKKNYRYRFLFFFVFLFILSIVVEFKYGITLGITLALLFWALVFCDITFHHEKYMNGLIKQYDLDRINKPICVYIVNFIYMIFVLLICMGNAFFAGINFLNGSTLVQFGLILCVYLFATPLVFIEKQRNWWAWATLVTLLLVIYTSIVINRWC